MALRVVKEFNDGDHVILGAGLPNLCALFIPEEKDVFFCAENGVFGYGHLLAAGEWEKADFDYVDAGYRFFATLPGMSLSDMGTSLDIIRGAHLDFAVLGALEVSEKGDLANWTLGSVHSIVYLWTVKCQPSNPLFFLYNQFLTAHLVFLQC